jgi:cytochrome c
MTRCGWIIAAVAVFAIVAGTAQAAETGEDVFNDNCITCHSTEAGVEKVGPSLAGVVGRPSGSLKDYPYSDAMAHAGLTWTKLMLDKYITSPQATVKGIKMSFDGLKNAKERSLLIDYLATLKAN